MGFVVVVVVVVVIVVVGGFVVFGCGFVSMPQVALVWVYALLYIFIYIFCMYALSVVDHRLFFCRAFLLFHGN